MKGTSHLLFGVISGTATAVIAKTICPDIDTNTVIVSSIIASLLPDADMPYSLIGKILIPISFPIYMIFGHRTITHSPLFLLILSILLMPHLSIGISVGLFCGYSGHLLMDIMTKGGIPLFYPFIKDRYSLTEIKTGIGGEEILSISYGLVYSILVSSFCLF